MISTVVNVNIKHKSIVTFFPLFKKSFAAGVIVYPCSGHTRIPPSLTYSTCDCHLHVTSVTWSLWRPFTGALYVTSAFLGIKNVVGFVCGRACVWGWGRRVRPEGVCVRVRPEGEAGGCVWGWCWRVCGRVRPERACEGEAGGCVRERACEGEACECMWGWGRRVCGGERRTLGVVQSLALITH